MDTKYLRFVTSPSLGSTTITDVLSKSQELLLGRIKWYGPWKQYCFFTGLRSTTITELNDISTFMENLMKARKEKGCQKLKKITPKSLG